MGHASTIDYDSLAKSYGAVSSAAPGSAPASSGVDYDALAKQHGALSSAPGDQNIGAIHKAWNWLWGIGPQYQHQGLVEQFQNSMDQNVTKLQGEMARGEVSPTIGSIATFGGGVLRDMAKTERNIAGPGNVAAGAAAALIPPLRAPIGAYYAIKGAKDALTPHQPGEPLPDEVQRRLGGAGTALLAGTGTYESLPRKPFVQDYQTWRDANFDKTDAGDFQGSSGARYSEPQLQAMHDALSTHLAKTPLKSLFGGVQQQMGDYRTWRNENFRPSSVGSGMWEGPDAQIHTEAAMRAMYDAKASVQTSVAQGLVQTLSGTAGKTAALARNNPITNTTIGINPESLTPIQAFTKATQPRNSIQNFNDHVERGLPDARRALDSLGVDPAPGGSMTLKDAEAAVFQAKKDVWSEFENNHLNPNQDVMVDTTPIAQAIQKVGTGMSAIQQRRMPGVVDEIQSNAADYDGQQMSVGDIEDRIQELNNQLRSQQATFKVNEMNLRRDPHYAHLFAELDGLRQMETQAFGVLDDAGAAAQDLKQRYGSLKVLQDVIDRQINRVERRNPAGLYETAGRMAGLGDIAGGVIGREPGRVVAGLVKLRAGQNAAKLNNPDFLIQQAFSKTEPSAPTVWEGEYEPEPPKGLLGPGPMITPPPADTSGSTPFTPPPVEQTTRAQRLGLLLPESTAIEVGPSTANQTREGVLPAARRVDAETGRVQFLTSAAPEGEVVQQPGPAAAPTAAENLAALRAKSRLVQDPVTKRMVRMYDNPVDNARGFGNIGANESQAQNGTAGTGAAVQGSRGAGAQVAPGGETAIPVPGEDRSYPAHYQVRELSDIQSSHSGVTFSPNSKYELTNDRDYSNAVNQGKVISASAPGKFDPSYHITDNPDATNGPIVIDSRGNALGGNGRAMILGRVYRYNSDGAQAYKDLLIKKAQQFGVDPAAIQNMKQPVLVREIDDSEFEPVTGKQVAVTNFNKKGTAELTPAERPLLGGNTVSPYEAFRDAFEPRGPADIL